MRSRESLEDSLVAAGALFSASAGVVLANFARIDIGRGDMENAQREAFGVVLGVVLAAVFAGKFGRNSESQVRDNPHLNHNLS